MKKILLVFLILIVITGCGKSNEVKKEADGYQITINDIDLKVDADFASIKDSLGKDFEYQEVESCAFEGKDSIYTYEDYEIYNYHDGNQEKVYSITLLNDNIKTNEGLKIGSSIDEVKKVYGNDYEELLGAYSYKKGNTILTFIYENDMVTSIEYKLDIDKDN